ncbi:hypothetical protein YC2023_039930 [Brassica napus]
MKNEDDDANMIDQIASNDCFTKIDPDIDDQTEPPNGKRLNISNTERWPIYNALLERSQNGELEKDTTREVSDLFLVPIRTVQRKTGKRHFK